MAQQYIPAASFDNGAVTIQLRYDDVGMVATGYVLQNDSADALWFQALYMPSSTPIAADGVTVDAGRQRTVPTPGGQTIDPSLGMPPEYACQYRWPA